MKLNKRTIYILIAVFLIIWLIIDWEDAKQGFIDGYNAQR